MSRLYKRDNQGGKRATIRIASWCRSVMIIAAKIVVRKRTDLNFFNFFGREPEVRRAWACQGTKKTKPDLTCGRPPVERGWLGFVPRCLVLVAVRQHPLHEAGCRCRARDR